MDEKNVYAGTGMSKNDDPYLAGKEAVEMAIKNMEQQGCKKGPDFGFVFCSGGKYGKDDKSMTKLVEGAHESFISNNPDCSWTGATSCGELTTDGFSNGSCVAIAINSQYMHFGVGVGTNINEAPEQAGKTAAQMALKAIKMDKYVDPYIQFLALKNKNPQEILKMQPYLFVTLFPGSSKTYLPQDDLVLKGISSVGGTVPLIGGSAADDAKFEGTYVFSNGKVQKDSVIVVGVISNLKLGIGIRHGYQPTPNVAMITKAHYKEMIELNGKPAAQAYAEITGTPLADLKQNIVPTTVNRPMGFMDMEGMYWLNCPFKATEHDTLLFLSPVKEGMPVNIMQGEKNKVVAATHEAIESSIEGLDTKNIAAMIIFSCGARVFYLQNDIVKEHELIAKTLGKKPFVGFYTYGEQGRVPSGRLGQHNQTFLCLTITDKLITE